jgi:N utilization substance protein B|tara:strand:- start:1027 stop:1428 length:402 start_codon:yes stop_codon:yes gene_type:complete
MKNLAKHKLAVKTREVLVQAIYQHLFEKTSSNEILDQFKKEHRPEKVDFKRFKLCMDELIKKIEVIEETISKKMKIKENEIELIDKAILCLGIIEMDIKMAPRSVVIDECIRLTKKFSNPESYRFINASLDKI